MALVEIITGHRHLNVLTLLLALKCFCCYGSSSDCLIAIRVAGGGLGVCSVYYWGSGVSRPLLLPLPSADVDISQVSAGRQQMSAVTRSGRLLLWQVGRSVCLSVS